MYSALVGGGSAFVFLGIIAALFWATVAVPEKRAQRSA